MNTNHLVSVIVPCYNQAQYMPETFESLLTQTYKNWECIIVNDGSPDNTEEVALHYCSLDSRFQYLKKENGGLSSARNAGLEASKGKYIQFLDSDDVIDPTKIEVSVEEFVQHNLDVVYTDFYAYVNNTDERIIKKDRVKLHKNAKGDLLHNWDRTFNIPQHCLMYTRSIIGNIRFDTTLPAKEDWDFIIKVFSQKTRSIFIAKHLCGYRNSMMSMSKNTVKMITGTYIVLNQNYKHGTFGEKCQILFNLAYRYGDWTVRSLSNEKSILKDHFNVLFNQWTKDKSWLILSLLLYPIGLIDKLCIVFRNRVLR